MIVGVAAGVGGTGVGVGVTEGNGVTVGVGLFTVIAPSPVVTVIGWSDVSDTAKPEMVTGDVPSATVAKSMLARTPSPVGPLTTPIVVQPNDTVPGPTSGARHVTVRPVEPRNAPLLMATYARMVGSHVRLRA